MMPQDAMHVVEECLYLQNWRGELMRKLREVVVEGGHKVNVWDSWGDGEKIEFVLRPCIVGVFSHECEIALKRQIGEALARLFLELKSVYGDNRDVSQMAVKVGGLAPADGVDFSVFVDTL